MIDEELQVDPDYQKGFNGGYILAKEDPTLFDQLMQSKNERSQYFQGMRFGGKEYLKEKFKEELQRDKEHREHNRGGNKDREKE